MKLYLIEIHFVMIPMVSPVSTCGSLRLIFLSGARVSSPAQMITVWYNMICFGKVCLHILSFLHVKQILALHSLLQQGSVLHHQGLNLGEQMAILFLQVALQLAQQLKITKTSRWTCIPMNVNYVNDEITKARSACCMYLPHTGW